MHSIGLKRNRDSANGKVMAVLSVSMLTMPDPSYHKKLIKERREISSSLIFWLDLLFYSTVK